MDDFLVNLKNVMKTSEMVFGKKGEAFIKIVYLIKGLWTRGSTETYERKHMEQVWFSQTVDEIAWNKNISSSGRPTSVTSGVISLKLVC